MPESINIQIYHHMTREAVDLTHHMTKEAVSLTSSYGLGDHIDTLLRNEDKVPLPLLLPMLLLYLPWPESGSGSAVPQRLVLMRGGRECMHAYIKAF